MTRHRGESFRVIGALVAVCLLPISRSVVAATFDFVHVEANAGGSSGGHVAACFTEHCYHFQQGATAQLLLVRETRERFEHGYRAVGNRSLVIRQVAVSDAEVTRLQETFASYHRVQRRQIEVRDAYRADRELLAFLQHNPIGSPQPASLTVPASGYFFGAATPEAVNAPSSVTVALADRVRTAYGPNFLGRRMDEVAEEIRRLQPSSEAVVLPATAALASASPTFFAERYRELLSASLALRVLQEGRDLMPGSYIAPGGPDFALTDAERSVLERRAAEITAELVQLLASRRPDWGYPMLVGIARLLTLNASLANGSLVLLDTFRADAQTMPAHTWEGFDDALAQLVQERREDLVRARVAYFDGGPSSEARWSRVEVAGNLLADMANAQRRHAALRVPDDAVIPQRGVWRADWPLPELDTRTLADAVAQASAHEQSYQEAFTALYRYDLVRRNCATELLHELAIGHAQQGDGRNPAGLLSFIPFVAAHEIGTAYDVTSTTTAPSYRQLALARAVAVSPVLATLREMNVLTARIYRWHREDPTFLLFSDDLFALRPIAGAANLAASALAVAAGTASSPIDGGTLLGDGLNGIIYSLPELVFVSIRKGSFPLAPRRWLTDDDGSSQRD